MQTFSSVPNLIMAGDRIPMIVDGYGLRQEQAFVRPSIFNTLEGISFVLSIFREESDKTHLFEVTIQMNGDLIAAYRMFKIFENMQFFKDDFLAYIYHAAKRDDPYAAKYMVDILGESGFEKALLTPIPSEISDLLVQLWQEGYPIYTPTVSEELRRKNLESRDEFEDIGVEYPVSLRAEVSARYIGHIIAYRASVDIDDDEANFVIDKSVELIERGYEVIYGQDVVLGTALVWMLNRRPGTGTIGDYIESAWSVSAWIHRHFRKKFLFWRIPIRPKREYSPLFLKFTGILDLLQEAEYSC